MGFYLDSTLVFLLQGISKSIFDQFADMIDVTTTFSCGDWVYKTHLFETVYWWGHGNFPSFAAFLINTLDLVARLVLISYEKSFNFFVKLMNVNLMFTFQEEIDVILEVFDRNFCTIQ